MNPSTGWNQIGTLPSDLSYGYVANIDKDKLMLVASKGVYTFCSASNQWESWIDDAVDINGYGDPLTFDDKSNTLYALAASTSKFIVIDIESRKVGTYYASPITGRWPCIKYVDGNIHVIGGTQSSKHFIWNINAKECKEVFDFEAILGLNTKRLEGCCLIYVATKNVFLLFGGHIKSGDKLSSVYQYSFIDGQWTKWSDSVTFDGEYAAAILTRDERYVIIVGGASSNDIFILDLKTESIRKSEIECPEYGANLIAKTGDQQRDDHLIHGFVKRTKEIQIPLEIVDLILKYYSREMIHWMKWSGNKKARHHHTISVERILQNDDDIVIF